MGSKIKDREQLRGKIASRRTERDTQKKYARLRQVAAGPNAKHVEAALSQLSESFGQLADHVANLRSNLGLNAAPKLASLAEKTAAVRAYASEFRHIAEENPAQLEGALNEIYRSVDEIAGGIEALAGNLGLTLETPAEEIPMEEHPAEEVPGVEPEVEEESEIEIEPEEEHEAAGVDGFNSDRDEKGQPRLPEKVDVAKSRVPLSS